MYTQHRLKGGDWKRSAENSYEQASCLAVSALFSATRHTVSLQLQQGAVFVARDTYCHPLFTACRITFAEKL